MTKLLASAICLFITGSAIAQTTSSAHKAITHKPVRPSVAGRIMDAHYHPVKGAQTFVYAKDSSIIASGYADSMGQYETNAVMPGTYTVKIVYPGVKTVTTVTGVIIKGGPTMLNIKTDIPTADTTMAYATLVPPVEKPKKAAKKK